MDYSKHKFLSEVTDIFSSVLNKSGLGADDDFFANGGDSILATTAVAKLHDAYGVPVRLTLETIFYQPTARAMAIYLESHQNAQQPDKAESVTRSSEYPLSPAQHRIWLTERLHPHSAAYHEFALFELTGSLDIDSFEAAVSNLAEAHESLRTIFTDNESGHPTQRYDRSASISLDVVEKNSLNDEQKFIREQITKPFSLSQGPLYRFLLILKGPNKQSFLVVAHHIVSDAWSLGLLVSDLSEYYNAHHSGKGIKAVRSSALYSEYVEWYRKHADTTEYSESLSYWHESLTGSPPTLDLAHDRTRPPLQTFRGGRLPVKLSKDLSKKVTAFCIGHGVTPSMFFFSCYVTMLARLSRQDDIVIGCPVAGRTQVEFHKSVGMFVNTLALRTFVSPDAVFLDILKAVKASTLAALTHQDVAYENVVEKLNPPRNLSHSPIFQILYLFQNAPKGLFEMEGIASDEVFFDPGVSKFDLLLSLTQTKEGFSGYLEFASDLFDRETVEQYVQSYVTLVASAIEFPDEKISALELHSASQKVILEAQSGERRLFSPVQLCVHELFRAQAQTFPDSISIIDRDRRITYGHLDAWSSRIADLLMSTGIGREKVVGVCIQRSAETVAAMLGVLKSGYAFLPLDPALPRDRLEFMCIQSGASAVICDENSSELAHTLSVADVYNICDPFVLQNCSSIDIDTDVRPGNLAHVLFTSGSSGTPKGVYSEHRSVVNRIIAQSEISPLSRNDIVASKSAIGFVDFVYEVFGPLLHGAVVNIYKGDDSTFDLRSFSAYLRAESITHMIGIPTLFSSINKLDPELRIPSVSVIMIGGAPADDDFFTNATITFPNARITNVYGSTEVAGDATYAAVSSDRSLDIIGNPVPGAAMYVLDEDLAHTPIGGLGEIYIGGENVSRGYVNAPSLTATKYLPDPFSKQPGARMFATGDLGRRTGDGSVSLRGRKDFQLKVNGVRIEPTEIQSQLLKTGLVREAFILKRGVGAGEHIVAFVSSTHPRETLGPLLTKALAKQLPKHYLPSKYEILSELPRTLSGKIDRVALSSIVSADTLALTPATPQSGSNVKLRKMWCELLEVKYVKDDDDFFALGGTSLLAAVLSSRVGREFQVDAPLSAFFEHTTLCDLAAFIDTARERISPAGDLRKLSSSQPYPVSQGASLIFPLTTPQKSILFLEAYNNNDGTYNNFRILSWRGRLELQVLESAIANLRDIHPMLGVRFPVLDGSQVQLIDGKTGPVFSAVELSDLQTPLEDYIRQQIRIPFDPHKGPLIRFLVITANSDAHTIVLVAHHAMSDAKSLSIVLNDLFKNYNARLAGRDARIEWPSSHYFDYAGQKNSSTADESLHYWREQLATAPPLLRLPTDQARPQIQSSKGARIPLRISAIDEKRVNELCKRLGVTPYMFLVAAVSLMLSKLSNDEDIVIGSPVSGRSHNEFDRVVGLFSNTLALRTTVDREVSFSEYLKTVKATVLSAFAHQEVPFVSVVEMVNPERTLSYSPIFQTMLNFQSSTDFDRTENRFLVTEIDFDPQTSKFDLTFSLHAEHSGGLSGYLEYCSDIFHHTTAEGLVHRFVELIRSVALNPAAPMSQLGGDAFIQNKDSLCSKETCYSSDVALHRHLSLQALSTPARTAITDGTENLTYRDLDEHSSRLAHFLLSQNFKREGVLGILLSGQATDIVAMYGALKAGGAFLPLDRSLPQQRLKHICERADVQFLVTSTPDRVPLDFNGIVLNVENFDAFSSYPVSSPEVEVFPANLAYIIFTSGSTGDPKAVHIEHRHIANYVSSLLEVVPLKGATEVLLLSSLSADIGYTALFPCLAAGGTLVMGGESQLEDLLELQTDPSHCYSLVKLTPTQATILVELKEAATGSPSFDWIVLGGEKLPLSLVRRIRKAWPRARIVNHYGPTESTVGAAYQLVAHESYLAPDERLEAFAHAKAYVLTTDLDTVAVGETGELYISGLGVGRGYGKNPKETAHRFVPDPFSKSPGQRMYRTGDLAKLHLGGSFEILGRLDNQVKRLGHRIELEEVEQELMRSGGIKASCVSLIGEKAPRLYAAVVPLIPSDHLTTLHQTLSQRLPNWMVPDHIFLFPNLPMTPNGKIDRQAVGKILAQKADLAGARGNRHFDGAMIGAVEQIWKDILQSDHVPTDKNFFDLGGTSIKLLQMQIGLSKISNKNVRITDLFRYTTIESLASWLSDPLN